MCNDIVGYNQMCWSLAHTFLYGTDLPFLHGICQDPGM